MLKSLVFALALVAFPAIAQDDPGYLSMTGSARIAAEPDITRASGNISVEGDSAETTLATAQERLNDLRKTMEPFGATHSSRITLGQSQSRSKSLIGSDEPGFIAHGTVTVTLSDPGKRGAALDALVKAGIDGIARLDYDIADRTALMTEAREKAVADAIERASTYARAANITLGPIVDLSEIRADRADTTYQGPASYDTYSYGAQGMAGARTFGVTATVTIRWAIL